MSTRGFTLVELLVSTALTTVLVGTAGFAFQSLERAGSRLDRKLRVVQASREALATLGRDLDATSRLEAARAGRPWLRLAGGENDVLSIVDRRGVEVRWWIEPGAGLRRATGEGSPHALVVEGATGLEVRWSTRDPGAAVRSAFARPHRSDTPVAPVASTLGGGVFLPTAPGGEPPTVALEVTVSVARADERHTFRRSFDVR